MIKKSKKEINYAAELIKLSEGTVTLQESIEQQKRSKLSVIQNINRECSKRANNSQIPKIWDNLYPILYDEQVIIQAYSNIRKNKGSTTPGISGTSIDGFSVKEIQNISTKLKEHKFKPRAVLQILIPKPGKTEKRPLGIPEFEDRIVAEMIRMILEAIYEPDFQLINLNHGFRPERSVHTALEKITYQIQGLDYTIEGDIKGAYPSLDHDIVMSLLRKKIKCKTFLNLVWDFLKAKIFDLESYQFDNSLSGVPQGQLFSPILFNIYMHEFDLFVKNDLQEFINNTYNVNRNETPKIQSSYIRITSMIRQKRDTIKRIKERNKEIPYISWNDKSKKQFKDLLTLIKNLVRERRNIPSRDKSKEKIRYHYVRYADDWIYTTNASLEITTKIKERIRIWLLDNLKFTLHPEKTKVTNIHKETFKFLGFSIGYYQNKRLAFVPTIANSVAKRSSLGLFINPDWDRIQSRLEANGYCSIDKSTQKIIPKEKPGYALQNLDEIYKKYNSILLGLFNYYCPIISTPSQLYRIQYILTYSFIKTCSHKYKKTVKTLYKDNMKNVILTTGEKPIKQYSEIAKVAGKETTLELMTLKKYQVTPGLKTPMVDKIFNEYKLNWRTKKSILYGKCLVCGTRYNLEAHHVRSVKSLNTSQLKKKEKKEYDLNLIMRSLNRKTVPLCRVHHKEQQTGKLSAFHNQNLMELYYFRIAQTEE